MDNQLNIPFTTIQKELSNTFLEREEVITGMILGMLTGQHVVLLGPPGTAKSMIAREVCSRIEGANYFERLLTKFSVIDEIFGPVSVAGLEQDVYRRIVTGKLPEAHIAFLDEIFKASSNILNTLLTIINERLYHNDGVAMKVPLIFLIGASNELPQDESLGALYDRFLLRYIVQYLDDSDNFKALLKFQTASTRTVVKYDELLRGQEAVTKVIIPDDVIDSILKLRDELKNDFSISDRRWKESLKLVQGSAFLAGRDTSTIDDVLVLCNCLWSEPQQMSKIIATVNQTLFPARSKILEIFDAACDSYHELMKDKSSDKTALGLETIKKVGSALKELRSIEVSDSVKAFQEAKLIELKNLERKTRDYTVNSVGV